MGNPFSEDLTRRVFVKDIGFVSMGLVLGILGGCEELADAIKHRPVRRWLRTGSSDVDDDIATYKEAVSLMKALPASDPRSWTAQAGGYWEGLGGVLLFPAGHGYFFGLHPALFFY